MLFRGKAVRNADRKPSRVTDGPCSSSPSVMTSVLTVSAPAANVK